MKSSLLLLGLAWLAVVSSAAGQSAPQMHDPQVQYERDEPDAARPTSGHVDSAPGVHDQLAPVRQDVDKELTQLRSLVEEQKKEIDLLHQKIKLLEKQLDQR